MTRARSRTGLLALLWMLIACRESPSKNAVILRHGAPPNQAGSVAKVPAHPEPSPTPAHPSSANPAVLLSWSAQSNVGRRPLQRSVQAVWKRLGSMDDTLLIQPINMFADSTALLLTDHANAKLVALSLADGARLWAAGSLGSGPKEWRGPLAIAGRHEGSIAVWDQTLRRVVLVSLDGTVLSSRSVPGVSATGGMCIADGRRALLGLTGRDSSSLAFVDLASAEVGEHIPLPWPAYRDVPSVGSQVVLGYAGGDCLIATLYGSGLARLSGHDGSIDTIAVVESVPLPVVEWRTTKWGRGISLGKGTVNGVSAVARVADFVVVAFGGSSPQRRRILDFYDWTTGRYEGSLIAQGDVESLAGIDDLLFMRTEDSSGFYRIDAVRIR